MAEDRKDLNSILEALHRRHGEALQAAGLSLEFAGAELPPPSLPRDLADCLDVLLAKALDRSRDAAISGRLRLVVGPVPPDGTRLRLLLEDDLPVETGAALFDRLSGAEVVEGGLSPELERLSEPACVGGAAEVEFDLYGDESGTTLWFEIPLPPGVNQEADIADRLRGWSRRPVYDRKDLLRRLGGDEELVVLVLAAFHEETPNLIAALESALSAGDLALVRRLVHSLKGSAGNVAAVMLSEAARAADWAAKSGHLPVVAAIVPRLRWEWERFERRSAAESP